jgi:hypothetical protein
MKNFKIEFHGPKNMWKTRTNQTQWFSTSFETGFHQKKLHFVSAHLWMLGFQLFEFSVYRQSHKN